MRWLAAFGALAVAGTVFASMQGAASVAVVDRGMVDNAFPGESMRDWKDFADHVAVVTVVDEAPVQRRGGPFGTLRRVWLRVDRVLWSAPHGARLPPVLSTRTYGWADEDREVEMKEEAAARLTLHRSYVAPLVLHDENPGAPYEWAPLTDASIMPVLRGRVIASGVWAGEARRRLHERTLEEAREIVVDEPAHPLADRYRRLRPYARMQRMAREGAFQDPQPG